MLFIRMSQHAPNELLALLVAAQGAKHSWLDVVQENIDMLQPQDFKFCLQCVALVEPSLRDKKVLHLGICVS